MNDPSAYQPGDRLHSMPTPPAYGVPTRPEGHAGTGDTPMAWTGPKPMPDHPDVPSPAHWFWIELAPRLRRRPRCGEIGVTDGR